MKITRMLCGAGVVAGLLATAMLSANVARAGNANSLFHSTEVAATATAPRRWRPTEPGYSPAPRLDSRPAGGCDFRYQGGIGLMDQVVLDHEAVEGADM